MFRNRAVRAALQLAVLVAGALLVVPAWMRAGSSPADVPAPLLDDPPLFAGAGQPRDVTAVVGGAPEEVTLVVADDGGSTFSYPMRSSSGGVWAATIPGEVVGSFDLDYFVRANHGALTSSSDKGRLVVLDEITTSLATTVTSAGRIVVEMEVGSDADQFGVRGGNESTTELPPSFAVDATAGRILVLDAVKNRIVTFDPRGRELDRTALVTESTTSSDIVVDPASDAAFVLDQQQDKLIRVGPGGQKVWSRIGAGGAPLGARLGYDERKETVYVRDATQGRVIPVVARGQIATGVQRANVRTGLPTSIGDLAVEVGEQHVTFGLTGTASRGYRVVFADDVLDASEAVVDGDGEIWALVGLYQRDAGTASTALLQLDPSNGSARATAVDPSVPGDVTRRLAPAERGVVLLEGEGRTLTLVGFDDL